LRSSVFCDRSEKEIQYLEPARPMGKSSTPSISQSRATRYPNISAARMNTASRIAAGQEHFDVDAVNHPPPV
jgi:hypothetical protein